MSTPFTAIDSSTGQVLYSGTADDLAALQQPGITILSEIAPPNTYRSGDAWVPIPARPSPRHTWDWTTNAWVDPRTPQQVLDEQWTQVRAERDRRMAAFEWRLMRHARETRLGLPHADDIAALDAHMQALADITLQPDPFAIVWPMPPA